MNPGIDPLPLTLEITNVSQSPIRIFPGMKAVKIIFFWLNTESTRDYSQMSKWGRDKE